MSESLNLLHEPRYHLAYSCYGLHLFADRALPAFPPLGGAKASSESSVTIQFEPSEPASEDNLFPWYSSDILDENGQPALTIWRHPNSGDYSIRYTHGLTFDLDTRLSRVVVRRLRPISDEDVIAFLLGPILGLLLRLRGVVCLHASAVALGDVAVAIAGTEGAGKSTTAAMFAQEGAGILSDDIVALHRRNGFFEALPGYSYLNLWPESLKIISAPPALLSATSPECDKLRLHLDGKHAKFQREPLPLGAVCVLGPRSEQDSAPHLVQLAPQAGLIQLIAQTYANRLLDPQMRAEEFAVLGRLVNSVPVWEVTPHVSPARLPEMTQKIRACCTASKACSRTA